MAISGLGVRQAQFLTSALLALSFSVAVVATLPREERIAEGTALPRLSEDGGHYVALARNFLDHGVVGKDNVPDAWRTVGYPIFLAALMSLLGPNWYLGVVVVQCLLCALYPIATTMLLRRLHGGNPPAWVTTGSFVAVLAAGASQVAPTQLGPDLPFATLFTLAVLCAERWIVLGRVTWGVLFVLSFGVAGLLRPTATPYVCIHPLLMMSVVEGGGLAWDRKRISIAVVSTFAALALVGIPIARNYVNYHYARPADVFARLLALHAGKVLAGSQDFDKWEAAIRAGGEEADPCLRDREWTMNALAVFRQQPGRTVSLFIGHLGTNLAASNWAFLGKWLGIALPGKARHEPGRVERESFPYMLWIRGWNIFHAAAFCLFAVYLVMLARSGRKLLALAMAAYVMVFLLPTGLDPGRARIRVPIDGIMIAAAFHLTRPAAPARPSH